MRFRKLGNVDVSVVTLGTWGMGGGRWGEADDEVSIKALQAGLDAGATTIDTAPGYGEGRSENIVGQAIKGRKREDIVISTKFGIRHEGGKLVYDGSADDIEMEINRSLKRFGTDYVDIYYMHWPDPNTPIKETFTKLQQLKEQKMIRCIGASNFSIDQIEEARKYCEFETLQPPYSLLKRGIEEDLLPYCVKNNIGILTYGSISAGALTGKYKEKPNLPENDVRKHFYDFFTDENWPKTKAMSDILGDIAREQNKPQVQVAINWVLKQTGITSALVGCKTPEQAVMNVGAGDWELSDEDDARIKARYNEVFGK